MVLPLSARLPPYLPGAGRYVLGPAELSGSVIAGATAAFASPIGQWVLDITFTKAGSAQFDDFAAGALPLRIPRTQPIHPSALSRP